MKNKNESKNLLKVLIDLLWYGSLFASIILILAIVLLFNEVYFFHIYFLWPKTFIIRIY